LLLAAGCLQLATGNHPFNEVRIFMNQSIAIAEYPLLLRKKKPCYD